MKVPSLLAVVVPVACGFIFGPEFVGGVIIGSTVCAIMIAIFTGNAGGAWDNSKKSIEAGAVEGAGKGSPEHDAAVVGDTVGDPLKDTVGPCLDIFIKIMSTVALRHRHRLCLPQSCQCSLRFARLSIPADIYRPAGTCKCALRPLLFSPLERTSAL